MTILFLGPGHIFYLILNPHVQDPLGTSFSFLVVLIHIDVICSDYVSNVPISFGNFLYFYAHAGATNKPQELDEAVLRRLVSILFHECGNSIVLGT
jgi:hypothetical protein